MSSLWQSLLFPATNWVAPRRLRRYGNIMYNYLKGIKANAKLSLGSSQVGVETKSLQSLEEVAKIIGYDFNNRTLLNQAFTHPSYHRDCVSYERLEYVGDSVLNLLITKEQFALYPDLPPGVLTPLRASNVDTEKLACVAVHHNFHRYIRLETPVLRKQVWVLTPLRASNVDTEKLACVAVHHNFHRYIRLETPVLRKQIQAFIEALPKHPLHSHGLLNAPKVLADVVESTIGAVFVDSNYSIDTTWEIASDLLKPIITPAMLEKNPVKKLFEICQKHKLKVKLVDLWAEERTYKVYVNNHLRGKGMCREKKEIALNRAANDAYKEVLRRTSQKNMK